MKCPPGTDEDVTLDTQLCRVLDVDHPVIQAPIGSASTPELAAALALGADGIWLGTRFVAAAESDAHEAYKRAVTAADENDTVYGEPFPKGWRGQSHRTLETETTERWEAQGRPSLDERSDADATIATTPDDEPVGRYADLPPLAGMDGEVEKLPQYAGQSAGLADDVRSSEAVVEQLLTEASETIDGLDAV